MDQSAADLLPKVCIEILPPDREEPCASDATTCPCCRKLRPASSMDEDGCGICDEKHLLLFLRHSNPRLRNCQKAMLTEFLVIDHGA
ncbi:hypothetical protein [Rhizobium aouanii]|uniref:Uncharacterized protein n=1 Tax=Rhizobium aouanii TaxID=3118145 RepID=A0ABU8CVZ7_9HYPH